MAKDHSATKTSDAMNMERRAAKMSSAYTKPKEQFRTCKCSDGAYRKLLIVTRETRTYDEEGRIKINGDVAHDRAQEHPLYEVHRTNLCAIHIGGKLILGFVITEEFTPL
jgi:hypothetical protein